MRISPVINIINHSYKPQLRQERDFVSFSGNAPKKSSFEEFRQAINNRPVEEVLRGAIVEENKLGEGAKKIVYDIPEADGFVVALLKGAETDYDAPMVECIDPYQGHNFGQPIAKNGADLILMRKINGKSLSLPDWTAFYRGVTYRNEKISKENARLFLSQIKEIEKFPLESYVDLAGQIKYLTDRGIKVDSINPNNIMVDYQNKKFQHFDLFSRPSNFDAIEPKNCTHDMINMLSDALLQPSYIEALSECEISELMDATKTVIKKCKRAGKIAGLAPDNSSSVQMMSYIQNSLMKRLGRNPNYLSHYEKFYALYSDELE